MPFDDYDSDDYDPENDPDWDTPETWPWDHIEHIYLERDESGWSISAEVDGVLIDIESGIDDAEAESYIWHEIYYLADEYDVDIDKEVSYAGD
jgi:hypothetical protein